MPQNRITGPQRRVKTRSALQQRRRHAFTTCVIAWKEAIAQGKTKAWTIYALHHPVIAKKGQTTTLFGWSWFLKINIARIYNDLDPILDPPGD